MKKIFFVTYGGGHVKIAIPVIKELESRGYRVSVLGLTSSVLELRNQPIDFRTLKDYINLFDEKEKISELGKRFIDVNYDQKSGLEKEEIQLYLGLNIYDLGIQLGSISEAIKVFEESGRGNFFPYYTMKKIVEYENPDVIFVTSGQRFEKAAAVIGNELVVPVIRVIDLLGENQKIPYYAKVCVMNEVVKQNILNSNPHLDKGDVIITGQPNMEMTYNENELEDFVSTHSLTKYKGVISFFSQPQNVQRKKVIEKLETILKKRSEFLCFFKLHPNEDISLYTDFMESNLTNLLIGKDIDTNLILSCSNVVMTFYSTVGLQAIYADKPLISINISDKDYIVDYSKYGCAVKLKELGDLEYLIDNLLDEKNDVRKKLKEARMNMVMPKSAASNIADVIGKLL